VVKFQNKLQHCRVLVKALLICESPPIHRSFIGEPYSKRISGCSSTAVRKCHEFA
jgi:hypothetical protein